MVLWTCSVEVPQVQFLDKFDVPVVFRDRALSLCKDCRDLTGAVLVHGYMPVVVSDGYDGPDSASHCLEVPLLQLRTGPPMATPLVVGGWSSVASQVPTLVGGLAGEARG